MKQEYLKKIQGTLTEYPKNKNVETEKNCVKHFEKLSTDKYKKRDMTIEIIEYEITN